MESMQFLLLILLLTPITINRLSESFPKLRLNPALLLFPLMFLVLAAFSYISKGPIFFKVTDISSYFSLGLKLDVLSGLIAATVSTIGIIVTRYSVRYLEDDPNQVDFRKNLTRTITFVLLMLMSSNLFLLFISWVGASYFLHQLLTHFSNREGAIKAAQQKFWVSRFGDLFIISAGIIVFVTFKTLEFETLFEMIKNPTFVLENHSLISAASILIVLGAMTKSAQFPFHYWLPNTMETPTPVSAIMHAGIINGGGYLVIRMSPLLSTAPLALSILAIVGGFTAFWATIVMFTQSNVKRNLAYSTIAQMGFMMLQCGLGAFSIAVVHIIGHAFYKAYAFLASGTATDFGRLNRYFPKPKLSQSLWAPFILAFLSISAVLAGLNMTGKNILEEPGVTVLLLVLSLAASQIILNGKYKLRALSMAAFIVALYLGLSQTMKVLLAGITPTTVQFEGYLAGTTLIICAGFFVVLYLFQNSLDRISETKIGKQIYVRALKGGF